MSQPGVRAGLFAKLRALPVGLKILSLVTASLLTLACGVVGAVVYTRGPLMQTVNQTLGDLGSREAEHMTAAALLLVEKTHNEINHTLEHSHHVAERVMRQQGGVHFSGEPLAWKAVNQFSKESGEVSLPGTMLGSTPVPQIFDTKTRCPGVDDVFDWTESTCTIFQRINESGDMLRVATNIIKADGQRAIGTYIPARMPDGSANEVIAKVLSGQTFVGKAYVVNDWYATSYAPLQDASGKVVGMLYVGVSMKSMTALREALAGMQVGQTGQITILGTQGDQYGKFIQAAQPALEGQSALEIRDELGREVYRELIDQAVTNKTASVQLTGQWKLPGVEEPSAKVVSARYYEPWGWLVVGTGYAEEFEEASAPIARALKALTVTSVVMAGVLLSVSLLAGWLLTRVIVGPLKAVLGVLGRVAGGDLSARVPVSSGDEVGRLALGVNDMLDTMGSLIGEVQQASQEVAGAATQIAASSEQIAQGTREQASQLTQVSSAITEMSASVAEVAGKSSDAARAAEGSGRLAQQGGTIVEGTIEGMNAINQAVANGAESVRQLGQRGEQIGRIIDVIKDIADQTNLLALNAAIEAARAGEHGRGFAVVADEVRKLADRTSVATDEIAQSIDAIQRETSQAVGRMNDGTSQVNAGVEKAMQAGQSLREIVQSAGHVAGLVQSIAAAAEQQSAASEEISQTVESIDQLTRQSAQGVEQSAAAGAQLSRKAEHLQRLVSRFVLARP